MFYNVIGLVQYGVRAGPIWCKVLGFNDVHFFKLNVLK